MSVAVADKPIVEHVGDPPIDDDVTAIPSFEAADVDHVPALHDRHLYSSIGVTTFVHLILIGSLAAWWAKDDASVIPDFVESRWDERQPARLPKEFEPAVQLRSPLVDSREASRSGRTMSLDSSARLRPVDVPTPVDSPEHLFAVDPGFVISDLAAKVGSPSAAGGPSSNRDDTGTDWEGTLGKIQGGGFFGVPALGRRVVYVVDCSKSMGHPHESPAKTRFNRVRLEMLYSITRMAPPQEFFIVFFNDEAIPMPARSMQVADQQVKHHYLGWMARAKPHGNTDPGDALKIALSLQPDVIFLLTDGRFRYSVARDVTAWNRKLKVTINTFCIGDRVGEELLSPIAKASGGKYRFVP